MSQQVNLYQPIFRAQPRVFSAITIVQAGVLLLVGLASMYGYARWQGAGLEREVTNLQARQASIVKGIEEFNARFPARKNTPELEQQLARLIEERNGKARALEALSDGVFGNMTGFSTYLEGLARQRLEGLWLTGLTITNGGAQLGLTGSAVEAPLVPRYLQQLAAVPALSGREFKTFQMVRGTAPARIDFTLQTAAEAAVPR